MDMSNSIVKLQFRTTRNMEFPVNGERHFQPVSPLGRGWTVFEDNLLRAQWCRARIPGLNLLGVPLTEEPSEYELAFFRSIGAYILGQKE